MAVLARYRKQPREVLTYRIDYGACWITEGQTLSSAVSYVERISPDSGAGTLVVGGPFLDSTTVLSYTVSGGLDGEEYKISIVATMSSTEVVEADINMKVRDS